jgi:hypothetical protein
VVFSVVKVVSAMDLLNRLKGRQLFEIYFLQGNDPGSEPSSAADLRSRTSWLH